MNKEELLAYACQKFQDGMYEEALEAFVLAYCKGYECEWVLENIYACYVRGNEQEFENAYRRVVGDGSVAYNDCALDFIPYKEGQYYIFDKEIASFRGIFSLNELEAIEPDLILKQMEFSAVALEFDWNWNDIKQVFVEAKNRKVYAICHDMKRCLSFAKIPELEAYFKNVTIFSNQDEFQDYFHNNTAIYLPKIIYGNEEDKVELTKIMETEHQYRLTSEGRNTDNVLLTIAIPTANRGNLVLKRLENLMQMQYDAEIEIAISKNCNDLYQEEYDKIPKIQDARIVYYDHGKDLKPHINWHYAVEMSHGKYVLLVSDEDDVLIDAIDHYFKLLADYPEVSVLGAKSALQGSLMKQRRYGKKGVEAFDTMFLGQNYMSGIAVRRKDFLEAKLLELERFSENRFYHYYPHEWWCALLSKTGDYLEEPVVLIVETDAVMKEEIQKYRELGLIEKIDVSLERTPVATYATYENRLMQFRGQVDFLHFFAEDDMEIVEKGLVQAIAKTAYLIEMARKYKYDCANYENYVNQYMKMAMTVLEEFPLNERQVINLLTLIRNWGKRLLDTEKKLLLEENGKM